MIENLGEKSGLDLRHLAQVVATTRDTDIILCLCGLQAHFSTLGPLPPTTSNDLYTPKKVSLVSLLRGLEHSSHPCFARYYQVSNESWILEPIYTHRRRTSYLCEIGILPVYQTLQF
jgi:hypothetical protein